MPTTRVSLFEPITKLVPLTSAKTPLRVLLVVPEVSPYATVGGVSRVAAHLAKELVNLGHDVRIFMPKYGFVDEEKYPLEMVVEGTDQFDLRGDRIPSPSPAHLDHA